MGPRRHRARRSPMNGAMNIAISGMLSASSSMTASASNIANMESLGPVPADGPQQPVAQTPGSVYQPVAVSQTATPGGGVSATVQPTTPSYTLAYDPSEPFANLQGMVAEPNIDPAQQVVNLVTASLAYKANIASLKAAESTFNALNTVT
jgi:flagellar basal-body rod protein FlgC